jgi:hypothetical protein
MTLQERVYECLERLDDPRPDDERAIREEMAKIIAECAEIADFWNRDVGLSPCHTDAMRAGQKVAGKAIGDAIRTLLK